VRTTRRAETAPVSDDLVRRTFTAPAPNRLWVADITSLPTWHGFLYLAVVLDVFSRRVVGWAMADHLRTELVLDALEMAVWNRMPWRWRSGIAARRPAWCTTRIVRMRRPAVPGKPRFPCDGPPGCRW
jgi:transposase InsO family protein